MSDKLISSILTAGAILILFLLVLPAFDKTRTLLGSINEREEIFQEAEQISNKVEELNSGINARKSDIDKIDLLLPKEKMLPELLSSMESIVSASGMTLTELNISELTAQEDIRKLAGSLKLNGNFLSFMDFLDLLEKNLRLIDVVTVDIAAQEIEGARTLNYDVRLEANYLPSE